MSWINLSATLIYFLGLLVLAIQGDRHAARFSGERTRRIVYVLGLGVYCTSWTFFGSVGLASTNGLDFLPIYLGPMLVFGFGWPLVARVARIARAQNITSIADFLAARYGKSEAVAAVAAAIATIGVVPDIALQLKAISETLMIGFRSSAPLAPASEWPDRLTFTVALLLALFAMAFGTRRVEAGERQNGLMATIAAESVVKLLAFLIVGAFVVWGMFGGMSDLFHRAAAAPEVRAALASPPNPAVWITLTLLSSGAILFLPRQFHVAIVENHSENDIKTAAVVFPLYLLAINFFVVPLAVAGLLKLPHAIDRDITVMALPLAAGNGPVAFIAMIGGLSAATAMVVVESVALSIMASNNLVLPLLLRAGRWPGGGARPSVEGEAGRLILRVRRAAILVVLVLAFVYYRFIGEAHLASIGILSFACVAQFGPAFVGALTWRRGTSLGAIAGLITGLAIWTFILLVPSLDAGLAAHPADYNAQMTTVVHGVFWSLLGNSLAYAVFSLARQPTPIERLQADIFVGKDATPMAQAFRLWRASVQAAEVEATVARYLGAQHTHEAFESFFAGRGQTYDPQAEADIQLLRIAEHLLASAIGAASARLVLSLLLRRRNVTSAAALRLLDDASAALLYNREMLQHALDFTRQGISVFDADLRLTCWNREFRDMFGLPAHYARNGVALDDILRLNAERGLYGEGAVDELVVARLERLTNSEPFRIRLATSGKAIETRSARMPDGGLVVTYSDVTEQFAAEQALEASNETLERRVRERTEELTQLNGELARAKAEAEDANISKTRFLAAAGHDILQPLNAARLYAATMMQRAAAGAPSSETSALAHNVDFGARSGGGHFPGPARNFAPRRRRDEGRTRLLPGRRPVQPDQDRIRAARREEAVEAHLRALRALGALRSPAAAPAVAEPRLQRDQIHPLRPRPGRRAPAARQAAVRGVGHRPRHSAGKAEKRVPGIRAPRRRRRRARPWPRPVHRRAHGPGARPSAVVALDARQGLGLHRHGAAGRIGAAESGARRPGRRAAPVAARRHGRGRHRQRQIHRGRDARAIVVLGLRPDRRGQPARGRRGTGAPKSGARRHSRRLPPR